MQNFIRVSVISLILLIITLTMPPMGNLGHVEMPQWILTLHQNLLRYFTRPQNANFLFSILTGQKGGLSARLVNDLDKLNLRFILSPSGLHLAGFLFFWKKGKKMLPIYLACWLLPTFYSLKRLALLRFFSLFNKKIKSINLFYLTFLISFLCGHFFKSPFGFTYSFLIVGTFFSIGYINIFKAFLALSASHLLIAIFQGNDFSFLGLLFSLILVNLFSFLLPLIFIFIGSFFIFPSHWLEPFIRFFIVLIHYAAKLSQGTFITSSVMLLCCLWILLLNKNKWWIMVCLILHSELVHAPAIYVEGSTVQAQQVSAHK